VVLFCHNTSMVEDEPYPKLLREKGGGGFPFLVFLDAEGDVVTPQGYDKFTVKGFEETLGKVNDLFKLEEQVKAGEKTAETPLFIAKAKLGRYTFAEASAKRTKLASESVAQKEEIDGLLFDLRIASILKKVNPRKAETFDTAKENLAAIKKAGNITKEQEERITDLEVGIDVDVILRTISRRDPESQQKAIDKFLGMRKAGRTPKKGRAAGTFWFLIMQHGFKEEDAKLAEDGMNGVKNAYGKNIRKEWVDKQQERLNELKEKGKDKDKGK